MTATIFTVAGQGHSQRQMNVKVQMDNCTLGAREKREGGPGIRLGCRQCAAYRNYSMEHNHPSAGDWEEFINSIA